jgi:hypothetical protein
MVRHITDRASRQFENPDVRLTTSARNESQRSAVRRKDTLIVERRMVGQPLKTCAVDTNAVDIRRAVSR